MIWLVVAAAGGLGAACRFLVDQAVTVRIRGVVPWGTLLVNVSGSFAAGVVAGLADGNMLSPDLGTVVAGGFLGAYTTFSTAMYEIVRLREEGAPLVALGDAVGSLVLAVAAALAGWFLAT